MITYPLTIPTLPGFSEFTWLDDSQVQVQRSEFNYISKVYAWDGQIRHFSAKVGNMPLAIAKEWQAWVGKLNGRQGTFLMQDPAGAAIRGAYDYNPSYVPKVAGASQNGPEMTTDGWPPSVTGLLLKGDWISINYRLYQLSDDANSDGSGASTLTVWPHVRTDVANNADIDVGIEAFGTFRMMGFPSMSTDPERWTKGVVLAGEEDF